MRLPASALAAAAVLSLASLAAEPAQAVAVCVAGDLHNTGGSPCEGVACTGWTGDTGWQTCYLDVGPCSCPPPPAPARAEA